MRDYINISPTPADEPCQQVGTANYSPQEARRECQRFIDVIRRTLGEEPPSASLRVKSFEHDFGTYYEVVCYFDSDDAESINYAFRCEGEAPTTWL